MDQISESLNIRIFMEERISARSAASFRPSTLNAPPSNNDSYKEDSTILLAEKMIEPIDEIW